MRESKRTGTWQDLYKGRQLPSTAVELSEKEKRKVFKIQMLQKQLSTSMNMDTDRHWDRRSSLWGRDHRQPVPPAADCSPADRP